MSHVEKKVQFFESYFWKKDSILWFKKNVSILWVICWKEGFNSLRHIQEIRLNSLRHIQELSFNSLRQIQEVRFNSLRHTQEVSFNSLRHIQKVRFNSLRHIQEVRFNSLRHIQEVRFNSLRHIQEVRFNSLRQDVFFFFFKNWINSLGHTVKNQFLETKKFNSLSHIEKEVHKKEVQLYKSCFKKKSILWVIFWKRVPFFESYFLKKKKGSILESYWKNIQSLSQIGKGSCLRVSCFSKKNQFLESRSKKKSSILGVTFKKKFNSWSHVQKKSSILGVTFQKVQLFESHSKKGSIICVTFKKRFNYLSHIQKKFQLFGSHFTKSSILWVV